MFSVRLGKVLPCRVIERLNRFTVSVMVNDEYAKAYLANTGRLDTVLHEGSKGYCLKRDGVGKTKYRLVGVKVKDLGIAVLDTLMHMRVFEECVGKGLIGWLRGCKILSKNVRVNKSMLDYMLECYGMRGYVELKSAVALANSYVADPDCPTLRGRRHVRDLISLTLRGFKTFLIFVAAIPKVKGFKLYEERDKVLAELIRKALRRGVKVKAIGIGASIVNSNFSIYLWNDNLKVVL